MRELGPALCNDSLYYPSWSVVHTGIGSLARGSQLARARARERAARARLSGNHAAAPKLRNGISA
eukprot:3477532-Pleurochrysis_carterae.AAC.1